MTIMLNTVCRDFHFFAPFLHAFLASNRKINHTSEDHGIRIDSARVLIAITAALSAGKFVKTCKTVSKFQNSIRQAIFFFQSRVAQKKTHLHLVRRFWNHVLTWASVIFSPRASAALSADARYFCLWNRFSSSATWIRVNEVRGFFRFGGVRFWYGWPIRRAMGNAAESDMGTKTEATWMTVGVVKCSLVLSSPSCLKLGELCF